MQPDAARDVKLFERAVKEDSDVEAIVGLGSMLMRRAGEMRSIAGRVARLYGRAVEMQQDWGCYVEHGSPAEGREEWCCEG